MAETDLHRQDMTDAIQELEDHFADQPRVYVSGNLLLYYEEGNRRKHVSPDVLVTIGIAKSRPPLLPAVEGGEGPRLHRRDHVEVHRREDMKTKFLLYRES